MSRVLWTLFAAVTLAGTALAADRTEAPRGQPPDPGLMQTYYFVLLYRGDQAESIPADSLHAIQEGHLANIQRLADEKKMALAGPFTDDTPLRGIFILRAASMDEAKQLCDSDPAIHAGRLRAEIHPWYGPRGIRTVFDEKYKLKPDQSAK
jgi:uncharacterized protein